MSKCWNCCVDNFGEYLVYTTKKELRVQNKCIAGVHLVGTLTIAVYVVVYTIIIEKGYQLVDYPNGYISTKVKGLGFDYQGTATNDSFESLDLVYPSIEMDGLFLTTALVDTFQTRGICDGDVECDSDEDCTAGNSGYDGIQNGECLNGLCQEYRWCPGENDTLTESNLIFGVENFTIFLKVALEFDAFGIHLTNTEDKLGTGDLITGYNLFTVKDILDSCGVEISDIQRTGMLVSGYVTYYCNFDNDDDCSSYPEFRWSREDIDETSVSSGFNFRKVIYSPNQDYHELTDRLLVKYLGIRFHFSIQGQGGKWDLVALSNTLGSGIALTAISVVITEFFLRHCIPERTFYTKKRMEVVSIEEEEEWVRTSMCGSEADSPKIIPLKGSPIFEKDADPETKKGSIGESGLVVRFI